MKKLWIAGLAICLSLTSFASCDFLKHEHIALEWQFTESSHWRNSKCTWNKCDIDPMIESHVDDDGDEVCDVCGFKHEHIVSDWQYNDYKHWRITTCVANICDVDPLEEDHVDEDENGCCDVCECVLKEEHIQHTGEYRASAYSHWYVYTCGCYSQPIAEMHDDQGEDGVCDICGHRFLERNVSELTFESVDYNGGYTQTYVFNFEINTVQYCAYIPFEQEPNFTVISTFSESEENTLIDKLYGYGLFDIEEHYQASDVVMDGGGWELSILFHDGTVKTSTGSNASPATVFNNCAKAFYEICGFGVVAYLPTEYSTPPQLSYAIESGEESCEYGGFGKLSDYQGNGRKVIGNYLYDINKSSIASHDFYEGEGYTLLMHTFNYGKEYKKFNRCIVKCFDYNEGLTNENVIYNGAWFTQTKIPLSLNKIYLVRLEFDNGDFVEYTFNTKTKIS